MNEKKITSLLVTTEQDYNKAKSTKKIKRNSTYSFSFAVRNKVTSRKKNLLLYKLLFFLLRQLLLYNTYRDKEKEIETLLK